MTYAERPADYFAEEICDFVARVASSQGPSVTGEDGLWVDRIINACYRSSDQGRRAGL